MTGFHRLSLLTLLIAALSGCASAPPPAPTPAVVGEVSLQRSSEVPEAWKLLDIGVLIFANEDDGGRADALGTDVFTEVRENERHLLPFLLRSTLVDSNQWGAIRVLPGADPSVDLLVEGSILHSDGERLTLEVLVTDSTGRRWLTRRYSDITSIEDYPAATDYRERNRQFGDFEDPFQDLYNSIANDLLLVRAQMSQALLQEIHQVADLRYAADLSPESFAGHLLRDENQHWSVVTLPATDDPMMQRVSNMRDRHHLFIDTVDEYYEALHEDTRAPYVIWRRYSFDQVQEEKAAAQRARDNSSYRSASGFQSLRQRYDRYRWSKIYEQEFRELASGFNRETAPEILELNRQVHGLSGTMEEQYIQWRRILRQLFALETGTAP